jgi:beta-lactamase superfamily II metal-dependent hydrolase
MANRLSAVIALPYKKRFILLTSDVNAQELKKIVYRMENSSLKNHTMIAAQIPHHGSVRNFDSKSWARIRRIFTREKMEAVFSVAPNHRRHPSKIVIRVLKRLGYVIRRTDDAMKRSRKGMVNFNQRHAEESWEVDDEYYGEKDVIIPMDK